MNLNRHALKVIRERTGVSKSQLADRAGVDRTLIHRLENGERNASPVVIRKIADALNCDLLALCDQPMEAA
jgi:transcriptional regulator with XRE-family HTH domain